MQVSETGLSHSMLDGGNSFYWAKEGSGDLRSWIKGNIVYLTLIWGPWAPLFRS